MRPFDNLLAREVYGKYTERPTVYLTGWDDYRQVSVCIAVVDKTTPDDVLREYEHAWSWTYDQNFLLERNDTWIVGLAYVDCDGGFEPLAFPDEELLPTQITVDHYMSIVAEVA